MKEKEKAEQRWMKRGRNEKIGRERETAAARAARKREEANGSHIDFPMFPRVVTIAPGEGARSRQVLPSSTATQFF